MRNLRDITANGKSIGEVRAFEELQVQERPIEAYAFSMELNYFFCRIEKHERNNISAFQFTPSPRILPIQLKFA